MILTACRTEKSPGNEPIPEEPHSLAGELKALYDISSLPRYLTNTENAQISSYDTTGKNDDGFNGLYSFIRRNSDSSLVLLDLKGGGVINRIWTATPTMDTLDFFIDDDNKISFSICFSDLFSGKIFPFTPPLCGNQLGGSYCYLPVPFEKSCKIVFRGKKIQFHQIQYRMYEEGAKIKSFSPLLNQEEKNAIAGISTLWNKKKRSVTDFSSSILTKSSSQVKLEPGKTITVFKTNKGGRIAAIEISPANAFEGLIKDTDIRITWDGEANPSVFCPVADFFGYAFGTASMQSLLLGSKDNVNYCYFPMPFDNSAKIELIRRQTESGSQNPADITVQVWYSSEKRVTEEEGKFSVYWNKNLKSLTGKPHIFSDIRGKGHYVGTILQAQGMMAGMTQFFEGDDSASIDGIFRLHGTGSEDYFNGGWYALLDRWDGRMSLPLHGSLGYSLPYCRTGGYRLYISDKLSFEKSFFNSIEHGPVGNRFPVDYTSVGLYYSDSPPERIAEPTGELCKVFIPDTLIIYPQLVDYNMFGNMNVVTSWKYRTGGESYLFTPGINSLLRISLKEIPRGEYELFFDIMKEPSGCDFSIWQRQKPVSDWISGYNSTEERAKNIYICNISLSESEETITIRFKTDKQKNSLLLNRMILIKAKSQPPPSGL
jgi:hypothetical protein